MAANSQSTSLAAERTKTHEWPQFRGGGGHAGVSPDDSVKPPLRLVWSYRGDSDTSGDAGAGVIVAGGKVFVNMEMTRSVVALDADTGRFLWEYRNRDMSYQQTSTYGDGRLYVWQRHYGRSSLAALNADTGKALWSRTFKESRRVIAGRRGVAFHDGKVLLADVDPEPVIIAMDAATGEDVWRAPLGTADGDMVAAPCVAGGKVFTGTRIKFERGMTEPVHGSVLALDPADGKVLWRNRTIYPSAPLVSDGTVVVAKINREVAMKAAENQKLYLLDAATGEERWSVPIKSLYGRTTITKDKVLQRFYGGRIVANDLKTGKQLWSRQIRTGSGCCSPSVSGKYAYVGTGSFNDSEGFWAWRFTEPPHRQKGYTGVSWTLHAIDLDTGKTVWQYVTGCNVCGDPAIAYGRLYFNSRDGRVYCFAPAKEGEPTAPESPDKTPSAPAEEVNRLLAEQVPAARPGRDWPMAGGSPERAGLEGINLTPPLELAWTLKTGDRIVSSAAIHDGRAFVGSLSGKIFAADLETGRILWAFKTAAARTPSPFQGEGGGEGEGLGGQAGRAPHPNPLPTGERGLPGAPVRCSPAVAGGLVYCGSDNGTFYALDANDGSVRWTYRAGGPIQASPAVVGGVVFFGANDHNVYALDRKTGRKLWRFRTEYPLVQAPPVVRGDQVFAAQWVDWACALDIATGKEQWRTCVPISIEALHIYRGNLWLRSPRQFAEFEPTTGKRLRIGNAQYGYNGLAFLKDALYTAGTGGADRADLTGPGEKLNRPIPNLEGVGVLKTKRLLGSPRLASMGTPLVLGDRLCFASRDGKVYITDTAGKPLWSVALGGTCHATPVAADGHLLIGCDDGTLYAFREKRE